jgi:hypothetical protein
LTLIAEQSAQPPSRGSLRRWSIGVLTCALMAGSASTALANHNGMSEGADGMICPHAAAGSGPLPPGATPDAPARTADAGPIEAPTTTSSAPSEAAGTPPAPKAKAPAPAPQAKSPAPAQTQRSTSKPATEVITRRAASTTPARAATPRAQAVKVEAVRPTARRVTSSASKPAARTGRRAAESSSRRVGPVRTDAAPARSESPERAVVRQPAAPAAAAPTEPGSPGYLTFGLGVLALSGLAGGILVRRRRRDGGMEGLATIDPDAPSSPDALDAELHEMITVTRADRILPEAESLGTDAEREAVGSR